MGLVADVRAALAANLATLGTPGDYQISKYLLSNTSSLTLMIMPGPPGGGDFTEYHQAMGKPGLAKLMFTVRAEVGVISDIAAQEKLDEFLDVSPGTSVMRAIETPDGPNGEVTLGGLVSSATVTRSVAGLVKRQDGSETIAAEWEIDVYT